MKTLQSLALKRFNLENPLGRRLMGKVLTYNTVKTMIKIA